jgi:hypothetical protein
MTVHIKRSYLSQEYFSIHQDQTVPNIIKIILSILHSRKQSLLVSPNLKMHYSKLLAAIAAVCIQSSLAVKVLTYSGPGCTGNVQDVVVDGGAACDGSVQPFQSYKENGWGKSNGQRIAFYSEPGCTTQSFIYDTYSYNGDYFHSGQCYDIDGHSPVHVAQGMKLY